MSIAQHIATLRKELPQEVKLVAVSKYQPLEHLQEAYAAGQRIFGENRPQEMAAKREQLPADVQWHFIGHLQTNKLKWVVGRAALIHSIDSLHLLQAVQKEALKQGCLQDVLLQVHIAQEESKQGFLPQELLEMDFTAWNVPEAASAGVRLCGLMGMATFTDNAAQVEAEFAQLQALFEALQAGPMAGNPYFKELSMGMSGDYPLALAHGSTLVRIGSAIFPPRPQTPLPPLR